jgi:hypothetical protein
VQGAAAYILHVQWTNTHLRRDCTAFSNTTCGVCEAGKSSAGGGLGCTVCREGKYSSSGSGYCSTVEAGEEVCSRAQSLELTRERFSAEQSIDPTPCFARAQSLELMRERFDAEQRLEPTPFRARDARVLAGREG